MGSDIEVVLMVVVVNINIGIYSGSINKFSKILFLCNFIVSVILIVLMKFKVGVFNSSVSVIVIVVLLLRESNKVISGDKISKGSLVII